LRQPWGESEGQSKEVGRRDNKPEWYTIPERDMIFGGFKADTIVDGKRYPSTEKNPDYFKSVHLCGDGLAAALKDAQEATKKEFLDKVVVDSLQFKAYFSGVHPSQSDKLKGILKSAPVKKGIKIVQVATLPSGKQIPLTTPPPSMFSSIPKDFDADKLKKKEDTSKFLGVPFIKFVPEARGVTSKSRRKLTALKEEEKQGMIWFPQIKSNNNSHNNTA
jgi:hypothetical protein